MRTRLIIGLAALFLACGGFAEAQPGSDSPPAPPPPPWPFEILRESRAGSQAKYLDAALRFLERRDEALADTAVKRDYLDIVPWFLVMVGEHDRAHEMESAFREEINFPRNPPTETSRLANHRAVPAVEHILNAARDRRVVMFNEEHRSSVQRAFMHRLIDGLAAQGYTHLALEALYSSSTISERRSPTLSDGFYLRDPVFGDLVRRARELGLEVVSYDNFDFNAGGPGESPVERENRRDAFAAGVLAKILEDPDARLIVLAGRGHISEKPAGEWKPMASVLKETTGIDPLTVELGSMVEQHDAKWEENEYRHADGRGQLKDGPVVFVDETGDAWSHGAFDMQVFHPRAGREHGRPEYLTLGGLRKPVATGVDAAELSEPVLVQARFAGEPEEAVPADQIIVWPGKNDGRKLLLRPGEYEIVAINRTGEALSRRKLTVE